MKGTGAVSSGPNKLIIFSMGLAVGLAAGFGARFLSTRSAKSSPTASSLFKKTLAKNDLSPILDKRVSPAAPFAPAETIKIDDNEFNVQYSIDSHLQEKIEQTIRRGKVPYGAFVAMDARTGQILAMVTHGKRGENMTLRSTFPAASIFKVVTAAAAIENGKLQYNSMIPVKGSYHTLYRQNVLRAGGIDPAEAPRRTRLISFEEALAKSVNSVFGKVGIFGVGSEGLRNVAARFGFNKPLPFELPVGVSRATIPDGNFELAESASGFTRLNTLSPLHGALIAAAVSNEGVMMEPGVVRRAISIDGKVGYEFQPKQLATILDKSTAHQLSLMMHKTIIDGTSRHAFHGMNRSLALNGVFIGGKTGTLNGDDPAGRYDWFIGFGEREQTRIAVAALCIHSSRRGIKASQVARTAFETIFQQTIAENPKGLAKKQSI